MSDFSDFKGILPYATELFGVYQPLLGWKANQAKLRVDRARIQFANRLFNQMVADNRFWRRVQEKPEVIGPGTTLEPVPPSWMSTNVLTTVMAEINQKKPTNKKEWREILSENKLNVILKSQKASKDYQALPSKANHIDGLGLKFYLKTSMKTHEFEEIGAHPIEGTDLMVAQTGSLENSSISTLRESIMAGTLNWLSKNVPQILPKLLLERKRDWETTCKFVDPLADFEENNLNFISNAILSPIGIVHLYREYFFEFDTFLGPPVGHLWISPGGTVELIEVHTNRIIEEKTIENITETSTKSEIQTTEQDELSDAIKEENSRNTKLGISASGGTNFGVWHAEASVNYGLESTHKVAEEATHKHMRQQSEKLTSEIRRSLKTTFRTTTEVQDTSSRRYVVTNNSNKLVNYELRRKMRKVGVQVQHIGTQMCWQVYIDDPGIHLGVAELVHAAQPKDAESSIQPPEAPAKLVSKESEVTVDFPYEKISGGYDTDALYFDLGDGKAVRSGGGVEINNINEYSAGAPPGFGYTLAESPVKEYSVQRVDPGEGDPTVVPKFERISDDKYKITLMQVHWNDQSTLRFVLKLVWNPPSQQQAEASYQAKMKDLTSKEERDERLEYVKAVRERIKKASNVLLRPSSDLREEERVIIYRRLIQMLTQVSPDQKLHLIAELIRTIFDVDKMLYFVAPDWWKPRQHIDSRQQIALATQTNTGKPIQLTEKDTISWGGAGEKGRDNYLITEEAQPARMGSSLGWLLQLDGDNHRNAFLNSPWVKAIIPIRPGRELDALKWLQLAHVEGTEGFTEDGQDVKYGGEEKELAGLTLKEALAKLATKICDMNTDIENTLASETVFEKGFDPLDGGFRAGKPYEIFDQWIEVMPTDQVVAQEYDSKIPK